MLQHNYTLYFHDFLQWYSILLKEKSIRKHFEYYEEDGFIFIKYFRTNEYQKIGKVIFFSDDEEEFNNKIEEIKKDKNAQFENMQIFFFQKT